MNLENRAKEMAAIYHENKNVEAVILAGSVSKNLHDEHSDIELHILWSCPPTDEDRKNPIEQIGGTLLSFHPYEDEEWSEAYLDPDGVKFEISSFLDETIERFLSDVVERYETDYDKQCIVASVQDGVGLYGEVKVKGLKTKAAAYPEALSESMISENLWLSNQWNNRKALLKRKDWLMLYNVMCGVEKNLLGVLFGLNQMYVHHPAFKWMHVSIEEMKIKPDDLHERLSYCLIGDPEKGIDELERLVEEVFELVEYHHPGLEISEQKKHVGYVK